MQFFMKELFLVEFVVELILCNIFICCLGTKRETALMDFNEEKNIRREYPVQAQIEYPGRTGPFWGKENQK